LIRGKAKERGGGRGKAVAALILRSVREGRGSEVDVKKGG